MTLFKFVQIWMKLTCNAICDVSFLRFRLIVWLLPAVLSSVLPPPPPPTDGWRHRPKRGGRKLNLNEKLVFIDRVREYRLITAAGNYRISVNLMTFLTADDIFHRPAMEIQIESPVTWPLTGADWTPLAFFIIGFSSNGWRGAKFGFQRKIQDRHQSLVEWFYFSRF